MIDIIIEEIILDARLAYRERAFEKGVVAIEENGIYNNRAGTVKCDAACVEVGVRLEVRADIDKHGITNYKERTEGIFGSREAG